MYPGRTQTEMTSVAAGKEGKGPNSQPVEPKINLFPGYLGRTLSCISIHCPKTLTERKMLSLYVVGVKAAISPEITWGWEDKWEPGALLYLQNLLSGSSGTCHVPGI